MHIQANNFDPFQGEILEGLLAAYQLHKSSNQLLNDTLCCILGMSLMSLKVSDPDLFLTYLSRSNRLLKGLLARYQLHKSSDQLKKNIHFENVLDQFKGH